MASLPATMRALRKLTPSPGYTMGNEPLSVPKGDEVLIKVEKAAICGSDISLYTWSAIAQVSHLLQLKTLLHLNFYTNPGDCHRSLHTRPRGHRDCGAAGARGNA